MDKTKFTAGSLEINKARQTLKDAGFFVDNLWHIDDVKIDYECTDEIAQKILSYALTNETIKETIRENISIIADESWLNFKY